jgi:hypothetical protein
MPATIAGSHLGPDTHANRPAANATGQPVGAIYSCTTHGLIYKSDGASWSTYATLGGSGMADPMTTRGDLIIRNAANSTARLAVGASARMSLQSDGTDVSWGVVPGTLLATNRYAPAAQTVYSSAAAAAITDVDATNMVVTCIVPASGNILVRLTAYADISAGTGDGWWGLRESTTNVPGSFGRVVRNQGNAVIATLSFNLTGLSAGSHTYKWAFASTTGGTTTRIIIQDGGTGLGWAPGLMEVWAA